MMTRKFNQLLVSLGVTITLLANAYPQSRTVMVQSNTGTLLFPTNLWSANASSARTGLGLGTAATNETSAFQASSAVLSNLASSNAVNLTNIRATNIVGVLSSSNIPPITLTNIDGTLAVVGGGTGATNAAGARTNIGLPLAALTNVTESAFRSAIGLPLAALTNTNEATFRTAIGLGTLDTASIQGVTAQTVTVTAGGGIVLQSVLSNAASFRTNIGLPAGILTNTTASGFRTDLGLGLTALTNTNVTNFRTAIELGATNEVAFGGIVLRDGDAIKSEAAGGGDLIVSAVSTVFGGAVGFNSTTNAAITRTNLGLGLPALTNTNEANFRSAVGLPLGALTNTNNATFRAAVDMPWAGLTNTNDVGIQAAIFTNTNTAPSVTTNFAGWISIKVGTLTNNFRIPVYQ
jgi:hypothetical protein